MAGQPSEYHRGDMDIREQTATFHSVMIASKWSCLVIAVGVLFFTLLFCTSAGFLSAAAAAIVVAVLGVVFLRERPSSH